MRTLALLYTALAIVAVVLWLTSYVHVINLKAGEKETDFYVLESRSGAILIHDVAYQDVQTGQFEESEPPRYCVPYALVVPAIVLPGVLGIICAMRKRGSDGSREVG